MKKFLTSLLAVALSGCALTPSYQERRAQSVSDEFTSPKPVAEVYSCIFHGWSVTEGSRRLMETAPLPNGQIVYTDTGTSAADITSLNSGTRVKIYAYEGRRDLLVSIARKCA